MVQKANMHHHIIKPLALAALCALALPLAAHASCGSAFCLTNTAWDVQGLYEGSGTVADLRFEYVDQSRLKRGGKNIDAQSVDEAEVPLYTLNRNLLLTVDHSFSPQWGVTVQLPAISRAHQSLVNDPPADQSVAEWKFAKLGDARIVARYQLLENADAAMVGGLRFGLKLPTGSHTVANAEGEPADRALQPGSGTTDLIAGAYLHGSFDLNSGWFAQATFSGPLNSKDGYKPGRVLGIDAGYRSTLPANTIGLVQLNLQHKWRETGANAETENSGGTFVSISPGLRYALGKDTHLYGFVQVPLSQRVNGVQTVEKWSALLGFNQSF